VSVLCHGYAADLKLVARGATQFRVPFKVPLNTASANGQVGSNTRGSTSDKSKSTGVSDVVPEEPPIDLTDRDDEFLPCEWDFRPQHWNKN
jgi:hypothetical protein